MHTVDNEHCAACGRVFGRSSKPRWAFTREGRPAGTIHTGCTPAWPGFTVYAPATEISQAAAHVWIWERHVTPNVGDDPVHWDVLGSLMDEPVEALNARQEEALAWLATGPNRRSPEHVAAVRTRHTALIRRFRAWRAALGQPVGQNGCS